MRLLPEGIVPYLLAAIATGLIALSVTIIFTDKDKDEKIELGSLNLGLGLFILFQSRILNIIGSPEWTVWLLGGSALSVLFISSYLTWRDWIHFSFDYY
jgi:hypothetical protein